MVRGRYIQRGRGTHGADVGGVKDAAGGPFLLGLLLLVHEGFPVGAGEGRSHERDGAILQRGELDGRKPGIDLPSDIGLRVGVPSTGPDEDRRATILAAPEHDQRVVGAGEPVDVVDLLLGRDGDAGAGNSGAVVGPGLGRGAGDGDDADLGGRDRLALAVLGAERVRAHGVERPLAGAVWHGGCAAGGAEHDLGRHVDGDHGGCKCEWEVIVCPLSEGGGIRLVFLQGLYTCRSDITAWMGERGEEREGCG